jgi:hypothetical protein
LVSQVRPIETSMCGSMPSTLRKVPVRSVPPRVGVSVVTGVPAGAPPGACGAAVAREADVAAAVAAPPAALLADAAALLVLVFLLPLLLLLLLQAARKTPVAPAAARPSALRRETERD